MGEIEVTPPIGKGKSPAISFQHWESIRLDYVTGKGNLAWCARKNNVSVSRVRTRAKTDGWQEQREDYFRELNLRKSIPLMAAALEPARYEGEVPMPAVQPLSADYFLKHAQAHHQNLDAIATAINRNWRVILDEGSTITTEQRASLTKETRELILLQRRLLAIPDIAPVKRTEKTRSTQGDIQISSLKAL